MSSAEPNKLAVIVRSAPFSNAQGQEALDAAINALNFDLEVSLVFMHDGIFQIKSGQAGVGLKNHSKSWGAVFDYGVERVMVHDLSLIARELETAQLFLECESVSRDQIAALIAEQDQVLVF